MMYQIVSLFVNISQTFLFNLILTDSLSESGFIVGLSPVYDPENLMFPCIIQRLM